MRILSATLLLLTLLLTTGCPDLKTPEQVASQADVSIRPYFPNVRTYALPKQRMILSFTCSTGTGYNLTAQVAEILPSIPGVSDLKKLQTYGAFTGTAAYDTLALGFENGLVVYDVATGTPGTREPSDDYDKLYAEACNLPSNTPAGQYAMIGIWRVTYTFKGAKRNTVWYDTLGAYRTKEQFERNRETEISARTPIIYKDLATRGWQDVNIKLLTVNAMPIGSKYVAH